MSVYLPTTSAFQWMESHLSTAVQRELHQNTRGEDFWGKVIFPLTLLMTPFCIVADIVVGVAHIVLSGVKGELDEELFWKISDRHFFVYPFQQITFFFFSIIGSIYYLNYVDGYLVGQQCVMEFSNEAYQGPPEIFNRIYYRIGQFEPFPGLHLNDHDRNKLRTFKEDAARFAYQFSKKSQIPDSEDSRVGPLLKRIKNAESVFQIFLQESPQSMYLVTEQFKAMKREIKESQALEFSQKEQILTYLHSAHDAMSSFFQIPYIYRTRLLAPFPQLPGIRA
ncbi:MAG: hypothetical protein AB7N99_01820 [Simkaniaceae bacterium]